MTIAVTNLKKNLNGTEIYHDLHFKVKTGKITAFFGPNGSGKSTLFNILSGMIIPDAGDVHCFFQPHEMSYLFQDYRESLLPWRTGFQNLAFPLEIEGLTKEDIKKRIDALLTLIKITLPLQKYPYEMSGGQQQMIAILRAMITEPKILLLDEPFSALDYENALLQRDLLQKYHKKHKATILIITHDIEEAVYLAEEIIVLSHRPTRVLGTIQNTLPFPRTLDTMHEKKFQETTKRVITIFKQAIQK